MDLVFLSGPKTNTWAINQMEKKVWYFTVQTKKTSLIRFELYVSDDKVRCLGQGNVREN